MRGNKLAVSEVEGYRGSGVAIVVMLSMKWTAGSNTLLSSGAPHL